MTWTRYWRWKDAGKATQIDGKLIRGKNYVPPDHDCPTPPWEECRCDQLPDEQTAHLREIIQA